MSKIQVSVPDGGVSASIDISGKELVGAYMIPLSVSWPTNPFAGNAPIPASVGLNIGVEIPTPSTWQPLPLRSGDTGHVKYPLPFGNSNASLAYAPMPDEYRSLPSPIQLFSSLPVDIEVVLVFKDGCSVTVNC